MAQNETAAAAAAPAPPQVIVQMIQPTIGEVTPGLSETLPGGSYRLRRPDGSTYAVNAHGKPLANDAGK